MQFLRYNNAKLFKYYFQITGIVFISVGAVILIMYRGYSNFVDIWFFAVPVIMIIVGIVVFITSFFGCCGAVKENHCMIVTVSFFFALLSLSRSFSDTVVISFLCPQTLYNPCWIRSPFLYLYKTFMQKQVQNIYSFFYFFNFFSHSQ